MNFRNIAVIAHVDHGKTTLIDSMLKQSGVFRENQLISERIMDSNELEKERGITILAKCTSFFYQDVKFNIVDTPGHADFGGEVERVLSMVDGVILLVDAAEGPMPQTKFVLSKALHLGLRPIVVINKVDRLDKRINEVLNEIFDLFVALDANNDQLDFPVLYTSGRNGWASLEHDKVGGNLEPLFAVMKSFVPAPKVAPTDQFSMLVNILTYDPYVGRVLIGKVYSGSATVGSNVKSLNLKAELVENTRLTKLFGFQGIERIPIKIAEAGDIVAIAGFERASVADTICASSVSLPISSIPIDPPTMSVTISVNDSPLAGQEGSKLTSRMILERLEKETQSNVTITLKVSPKGDSFEVGGRGELQIGVLIETMRREGFELSVSKPKVLFKQRDGVMLEPIEEVVVDVDEEYSGAVVEKLSMRKGEIIEMKPFGHGKTRIIFYVPARGLIGYQSEFRNDTRGTGILSRLFHDYQPFKGEIATRKTGALISNSTGESTAYALWNLEERGVLFIPPKTKVYQGMIIGEHSRDNDLEVNPVKGKQLTNMRASGSDENIRLTPHKVFTIEEIISYIKDDELVEVTPCSIRLRKKLLCPHERKKALR